MRDSFIVRTVIRLWLTSMGITGFVNKTITFFASWFLGSLLEKGIIKIDITLNAVEMSRLQKDFEQVALEEYWRAHARVYDESEKEAIRLQYLDTLAKFVHSGVRNG